MRHMESASEMKGRHLENALRKVMAEEGRAEAVVRAIVAQAELGNVNAYRELADRLEGKVANRLDATVESRYLIEEVGVLDVEGETVSQPVGALTQKSDPPGADPDAVTPTPIQAIPPVGGPIPFSAPAAVEKEVAKRRGRGAR